MESVILTALTSLSEMNSWWYCIDTGPEDPHSLSGLLCINQAELNFVLTELKWFRKRVNKSTMDVTYQFCNDKVVQFLSCYKLLHSVECNKRLHEMKLRTFLRIGKKTKMTISIDEQLQQAVLNPSRCCSRYRFITATFRSSMMNIMKNMPLHLVSSEPEERSCCPPPPKKSKPSLAVPETVLSASSRLTNLMQDKDLFKTYLKKFRPR